MIQIRELLPLIGFDEVSDDILAEKMPGYCTVFDGFYLEAAEWIGKNYEDVMEFRSQWGETSPEMDFTFELPLQVETLHLGIAQIVRGLLPHCQPILTPRWFELGRKWQGQLTGRGDKLALRPSSKVECRDIFYLLGFREDWNAMVDQQPGYYLDLGNIEASMNQVTGKSFGTVMLIDGFAKSERTMAHIEFEMPLEVESIEQGLAFLAHAIGPDIEPEKSAAWLSLGRKYEACLPWKQAAT